MYTKAELLDLYSMNLEDLLNESRKYLKDEVESYFKRFKLGEPIMVDIGGTGDIKSDFKGLSPVLKNKDEFDQYFISATLQEDKQYDPLEEEKCETCSGCGFH